MLLGAPTMKCPGPYASYLNRTLELKGMVLGQLTVMEVAPALGGHAMPDAYIFPLAWRFVYGDSQLNCEMVFGSVLVPWQTTLP